MLLGSSGGRFPWSRCLWLLCTNEVQHHSEVLQVPLGQLAVLEEARLVLLQIGLAEWEVLVLQVVTSGNGATFLAELPVSPKVK